MRSSIVILMLPLLVATAAGAQERTSLPGIVVGPPPPGPPPLVLQPPAPQVPASPTIGPSQGAEAGPRSGDGGGAPNARCGNATGGNDRSLGCLNEKLKQQVDKVNPTANIPPLDAKSADPKVGVISIPGVRQQYGPNFGVSVYPYRPPAAVYAPPTAHR
ncbi:MAG: hypothetical protein AB1586_01180 [Pseudomonadota bacterium]